MHSFLVYAKKNTEKSEAKNLCLEVHWGGGWGWGVHSNLKKDDNRFLFFSGFRVFRI